MNGKRTCDSKIVRGGDWGDPPRMLRSGFRNWARLAPGSQLITIAAEVLVFA